MYPIHVIDRVEHEEVVYDKCNGTQKTWPESLEVCFGICIEQVRVKWYKPDSLKVSHEPLRALEPLHLLGLHESGVHETPERLKTFERRVDHLQKDGDLARVRQRHGAQQHLELQPPDRPHVHSVVAVALQQPLVDRDAGQPDHVLDRRKPYQLILGPAMICHHHGRPRDRKEGVLHVLREQLEHHPSGPPIITQVPVRA
mmetsp:Transcript_49538/g.143734  ORF Transcript_49538/g.143734 Transcript_49538/m.143734 type:complete len:200 (+) Transcript_49538:504-1103(+)